MVFEISGLTVGYAGQPVIEEASLALARGDAVAIAGHNGSGKSTLLKAMGGIIQPMSGRIRGKAVLLLQVPQPFGALTVRESLELAAGSSLVTIDDDIEELGISGKIVRDNLSFGFRRCCDFLMAVYRKPDCLLLDEPDAGMSIERLAWMRARLLRALRSSEIGATVYTHHCNKIGLIPPSSTRIIESRHLVDRPYVLAPEH